VPATITETHTLRTTKRITHTHITLAPRPHGRQNAARP
jgi:hypothetical protein